MTTASGSAAPPVGKRGSDFAELARWVKRAGLLRRRYGYYATRIAANAVLFSGGVAAFVLIGDLWWQLGVAVFFAVMSTQFAFMGHDAGHKQIFRSRRRNDLVGYVHGALTGISYRWWVGKHNQHHANPNHEDEDPDLEIAAIAFSRGQSETKRGLFRWITKHQAPLFFPLLLAEAIMLRIGSVRAILRGEVKSRRLEAALLFGHIVCYLTAVFLVLSPVKAVLFVVVHQGLMGVYLGCSFAPNHKGMPMLSGDEKPDYLRKQVLTARNVRGGKWADFLLGGLNHQIEHHLFPSMPRPNLRRAEPLVREFCAQHGISYSQCGLLRSYAHVVRHLHAVSEPLRRRPGSEVA